MTILTKTISTIRWRFWLGVMFFVAVILSLFVLAWYLQAQVRADETMPVSAIKLSGEVKYTQKEDVVNALNSVNLSNFFQVNVNEIQQQLAKLPWVYSVSVRKQWPNELKVYLVDQTPVALWNGDFLINQYGEVFQANTELLKQSLPHFYGPEGSEKVALENFENFNKLLRFGELAIAELVLTERFSWQLTLNDGVLLNLGREHRFERIARFMDLYPEINKHKKENQQVDYVDLRYDTGAAVGWKTIAVSKKIATAQTRKAMIKPIIKTVELTINV